MLVEGAHPPAGAQLDAQVLEALLEGLEGH